MILSSIWESLTKPLQTLRNPGARNSYLLYVLKIPFPEVSHYAFTHSLFITLFSYAAIDHAPVHCTPVRYAPIPSINDSRLSAEQPTRSGRTVNC